MFGPSQKKCELCNSDNTFSTLVYKLAKSTKIPFSTTSPHIGMKIVEDMGGYDIAFTDTNPNNPDGSMYLYIIGSDLGQHIFCSLQCCYDYSTKMNSLVLYQDTENPKQLRGISPDIVQINAGLGNDESYKFRGQPAGNL